MNIKLLIDFLIYKYDRFGYKFIGWTLVYLARLTIWVHNKNTAVQIYLSNKLDRHGDRSINRRLAKKAMATAHYIKNKGI